ncbi:putative peptidoglycan binding protein, partial [Ruminiclostridium sufflavum DSM 19573]
TDPTGHAVAKLGTRGDTVQAIQEKLNKLGYNVGKADGIFGEKTKAAVIKFQKDNGLTVDGIVGNQTLTEIYFEQSKQSAKANGINLPEAQKAKVGQISGNVSIMTDAKFNQAIANIVETKAKTNGGSLNTDVKNNEIVVTKVNIGTKTPTSAPATVTPKTAVPAASSSQMSSLTNTVAKISSAIAESNAAAVTASKSTSSISNGNTKNILNTIVNTAIEFAAGAAVAAVAADNNMMFGAAQGISGENIQSDSVAFNTGKLTVDAGTAIKGISTLVGGLGGEIIGVGLDGTIIFAPAGVAVAVASAGAVAYGGAVTYRSMNNLVNDSRDLINSATQGGSNASRMTTKEAKAAAKELGYEPTNYVTKSGEKVFYNKKTKTYISQDVGSGNGMGSHNGGVWKAAKSPEALNSKDTRLGTYDANMNRIGD